jgi:hypothetical protein
MVVLNPAWQTDRRIFPIGRVTVLFTDTTSHSPSDCPAPPLPGRYCAAVCERSSAWRFLSV